MLDYFHFQKQNVNLLRQHLKIFMKNGYAHATDDAFKQKKKTYATAGDRE